jgi:hypothetical protein
VPPVLQGLKLFILSEVLSAVSALIPIGWYRIGAVKGEFYHLADHG